ncbi:MAG: Ldh family oxidoreductase [Candidatus Bathyarchaeia archaeon]
MPLLKREELIREVVSILGRFGVGDDEASIVADALVEANLRGVESHGVRLLPVYVNRIKHGTLRPGLEPKVVSEAPSTALLDGGFGFGQTIGVKAMEMAVRKAHETGVGVVGVKNINHFGMAAYYALQAIKQGVIGMAFCNTKPHVVAWGGRMPVLGTNPICVGVPAGEEMPIVLDMATSAAAWGRVRMARDRGEEIPRGWAVDERGRVTTDPAEAMEGGLLPFGGYKGYGLALLVDILSGVLTGAESGPGVISLWDEEEFPTLGQLFVALDFNRMGAEGFRGKVDALIRAVKGSPPAEGVEEILMSGEREFKVRERRLREGIPIDEGTWKALKELKRSPT